VGLIGLAGSLTCGCGVAFAQIDGGVLTSTGSDPYPRYFHAASRLDNGLVMVTGGLTISFIPPTLISRTEISFYEPASGVFSTTFHPLNGDPAVTPALAAARSSHTQTTLPDGRVLITGGNTGASGTSPGTPIASVEVFDPWTGSVSAGPAMSAARAMHTATSLPDGRVVVAGGGTWQVFDWVSDTWSASYALAKTRTAHAAVLLPDYAGTAGDNRVLLVGGSGSGPASCELLDPDAGSTTLLTATLATGVDDLAAVALPDGRVFIAGGQDLTTGDTIPDTYLLDPVADQLTPAPDLPNRAGGAADQQIVRTGWHVVLLGGEQQASGVDTVLDYVAVFDASAGAWLDDGAMLTVHDDFAAVPLTNCRTLIIDGGVPFLGEEVPSPNCEVLEFTDPAICLSGDLNNDGAVTAADQAAFSPCCSGPGAAPAPNECLNADLDADGDADLRDFAALQRAAG